MTDAGFRLQTRIPALVDTGAGSVSVERILRNAVFVILNAEWPENLEDRANIALDDLEILIARINRG